MPESLIMSAQGRKRTFKTPFSTSAFGHKRSPAIFAPDKNQTPNGCLLHALRQTSRCAVHEGAIGQKQSFCQAATASRVEPGASQIGLVRGYGTDDFVYLVFLSLVRLDPSALPNKYDCLTVRTYAVLNATFLSPRGLIPDIAP